MLSGINWAESFREDFDDIGTARYTTKNRSNQKMQKNEIRILNWLLFYLFTLISSEYTNILT